MDATASAGRARVILAKPRRGGATACAGVALAAARIGDNRRGALSCDAMNPLSFAPIVQNPVLVCAVLLTVSNLFMTFAWYGHLKHLQGSPWWTAALVSWGIALFEYTAIEGRSCMTQAIR